MDKYFLLLLNIQVLIGIVISGVGLLNIVAGLACLSLDSKRSLSIINEDNQ